MNTARITTIIAILILLSWTIPVAIAQHNHGGGHQGHQGMDHQQTGHPMEHAAMPKTGSFKGRIMEAKEGMMVVEGKHQGKVQRMTVRSDHDTKIEGLVEKGSEVTIQYREDPGGMLYATAVKGPKPKKS